MRYALILLLLCFMVGCGAAHRNRLASDLEDSKGVYKQCLKAKSESQCGKEKAIYEADLKAYEAAQRGKPGVVFVPN